MSKPKIYIDFDNVTVDSISKICEMYNDDFREYEDFEAVNPCSINSYDFTELPLITKEQIQTYFCTPRFFRNLELMPMAYWAMDKLIMDGYKLCIVSCGYTPNLSLKKKWVEQGNVPFGTEFIGINFDEYKDKSHIDMSDGILIDDEYRYLKSSNAYKNVIFGDIFPWNNVDESTFIRCKNWIEVLREIQSTDIV